MNTAGQAEGQVAMRVFSSPEEFADAAGESLGTSAWVVVDQDRIQRFADATDDQQWIHTDPERAAAGPFGSAIAHGFLTLSLLPSLLGSLYRVDGVRMALNYGLEKVRFPAPVPAGCRIRLSAQLTSTRHGEGFVESVVTSTFEIEGGTKPACVAQTVGRAYS